MSLIRLRAQIRRRRHQAGSVAVLLALSTAVVVHHFEPAGGHAAPAVTAHAGHGAPEPATSMDAAALELCLAVLPMLAILAIVITGAIVLRRTILTASPNAAPARGHPRPPGRASRAGPRVLCVMRC